MRGSSSNISPALAARLGPPVSGSEVPRGGEGGRGGAGIVSQLRRGGSEAATSGSEAARTNAVRGGSDYSRLRGIIRTQKDTIQVGLQHASLPAAHPCDPPCPGTSYRAILKLRTWGKCMGSSTPHEKGWGTAWFVLRAIGRSMRVAVWEPDTVRGELALWGVAQLGFAVRGCKWVGPALRWFQTYLTLHAAKHAGQSRGTHSAWPRQL